MKRLAIVSGIILATLAAYVAFAVFARVLLELHP